MWSKGVEKTNLFQILIKEVEKKKLIFGVFCLWYKISNYYKESSNTFF